MKAAVDRARYSHRARFSLSAFEWRRKIARVLASAMIGCLAAGKVHACGEFFGIALLDDRHTSLTTLWDASFALEATRLVPPPTNLRWHVFLDASGNPVQDVDQADALREQLLTPEQRKAWTEVLAGEVPRAGVLSPALFRYAHGARAWAAADYPAALQAFSSASRQQDDPGSPWTLLAVYMSARTLLKQGNNTAAAAAFEAVTRRSAQGEPDPLSLGVRALSEAATARQRDGDWIAAVRLQMSQAAFGLRDAPVSLKWRIQAALRAQGGLESLLSDAWTRDAVVLYALAHFPSPGSGGHWELDRPAPPAKHEESRDAGAPQVKLEPLRAEEVLQAILQHLRDAPEAEPRGADRLAALLYRQGRYDLAEQFAAASSSGLSAWVGAKLAVRRGDLDRARNLFAVAARAFPLDEYWGQDVMGNHIPRVPSCRIQAESGIVALSRGELVESLEFFLRAGAVYWHDAAYVAERVLTVQELQDVVGRIDELEIAVAAEPEPDIPIDRLEAWAREGRVVYDPRKAIRHLLARRLMRSGQHEQAIGHFENDALRAHARRFSELHAAANETSGAARARSLFMAAKLARQHGLDLLAFDSSPDWAVLRANYAMSGPLEQVLAIGKQDAPTNDQRVDPDRWIGASERERVRQHHSPPEPRFSYRLTAAQLANAAADALPPSSQAFSAVLCHATSWLLAREPELARVYYRRYLAEGKTQTWHQQFGKQCPEPDLEAVSR